MLWEVVQWGGIPTVRATNLLPIAVHMPAQMGQIQPHELHLQPLAPQPAPQQPPAPLMGQPEPQPAAPDLFWEQDAIQALLDELIGHPAPQEPPNQLPHLEDILVDLQHIEQDEDEGIEDISDPEDQPQPEE